MKTRLETLEFAAGGQQLAGTLLAPATVLPGILFVHGWGGSQEQDLDRARQAAGLGCSCLTFDLRGHERTRIQRDTVTEMIVGARANEAAKTTGKTARAA